MNRFLCAVAALILAAWFAPADKAQAANCSGYPYTLVNGQTADAAKVMADFNTVMSCANSNLAHNGANSDITSLNGLTTPLSLGQGGTGTTVGPIAANDIRNPAFLGGARCNGVYDDTAAIQVALDAGLSSVYVPPTELGCKFSTLTMPVSVVGFMLYGSGSGSRLIQTGAGIKWPVNLSIDYHSEWIANLYIDGTAGTSHTIDTSYEGGVTLFNLYFNNVPVGKASIFSDGSSTTYTHDNRMSGIQIYSATAGDSGILLGAHHSDAKISDFIMNGEFVVDYAIHTLDGAQTTQISDSHPYNTASHVFFGEGSATSSTGFNFTNVVFDRASTDDIVYLNNFFDTTFNGVYFEGAQAGFNGLTLNDSLNTMLIAPNFDGAAGSAYMVEETGTTAGTQVSGGFSTDIGNFNDPPFKFTDPSTSIAKGFLGYTNLGKVTAHTGISSTPLLAGQTRYYGPNGGTAVIDNGEFTISAPGGVLTDAAVYLQTAPGAAKTVTVTLVKNGVAVTAAPGSANPCVITGAASFGCTIIVASDGSQSIAAGDTMTLEVISGALAASTNVRYVLNTVQ